MATSGGETGPDPTEVTSIITGAEFAGDLLLAEYRALRDEILKKMDHRTSLVVCSVTVSSAVLGFGIDRKSASLLLVAPLVSLLLGILIVFYNMQIGVASEYLRNRYEKPLSRRFQGFTGWHEGMGDPDVRLLQRLVPYHLPLILIATAPLIVAVPLAVSLGNTFTSGIPVLVVVVGLLVVYVVELLRNRKLL
ncbi:hypothetical protein [Amycolatopsis lexingtonensis]|uniref:hypothetical protein n=1 Tax=Amycolatopsis lexingtonensis TaxID=218822 RepID=UPI003F6EEF7A